MKNKNRLWSVMWTLAYIISILVCIASYAITYLTENVQVASFSQLLYTMQVSMGGAENVINQVVIGFLQNYSGWLAVLTLIYIVGRRAVLWALALHENKNTRYQIQKITWSMTALGMCCCLVCSAMLGDRLQEAYSIMGIEEYLESRSHYSTLYEDWYVKPDDTTITMPEQKKNLIYIFCESMEATYEDVVDEEGTHNLIPNLTRLAAENTSFGGQGARVTNSASWTIAGMVAQTSGTPLCLSNSTFNKSFGDEVAFMPKVESLGEILEDNGYTNYLMVGSDAAYGGRANYFSQHGDYEIFDLYTAREEGYIPEDYKEWWGFEDAKLFEFAKEKILDLAAEDEPFNFTMLTADTHFKDGYECEDCEEIYDEQMENVIHCSDKRIAEFVSWIQQQDFADDTVIIISGDHLNMDGLIPEIVPDDDVRHTYFTIINGPETGSMAASREFTTLDIFPTTLAALGADIEGDRLGLGVNLYSGVPTLCEQMGFTEFNEQISYNSKYYDEEILDTTEGSDQDLS